MGRNNPRHPKPEADWRIQLLLGAENKTKCTPQEYKAGGRASLLHCETLKMKLKLKYNLYNCHSVPPMAGFTDFYPTFLHVLTAGMTTVLCVCEDGWEVF